MCFATDFNVCFVVFILFKIYASVALRAKCDYGHLMQEGDAKFNTHEHYFGMKQIYADLLDFFVNNFFYQLVQQQQLSWM